MEITASVMRSFTDIFYMLHIIFQFRTGFIAPSSRVIGRGVLVEDTWAIAKRYLSSYFLIDILSVLPLPQVVISSYLNTKNVLKFVVIFQYVPRFIRIYPLYKEVATSGIVTETAWAGAAFNLFLYMLASHNDKQIVGDKPVGHKTHAGMNICFVMEMVSGVVLSSTGFSLKFFNCFWWGLRNLSSLGQNLKTSTYVWEICFAIFISISGMVLLAFITGNFQVGVVFFI
ncbi:hypothetical protein OIU78_017279 [Salix suchowensis]|nr:hypothetical protein OIU78_017279 [Salix suchowensis]